jgi:hypothetical protein
MSKHCYGVDVVYRDLHYLLLKAQRLAATKTEFVAIRRAA